jgi:hypothetical protein
VYPKDDKTTLFSGLNSIASPFLVLENGFLEGTFSDCPATASINSRSSITAGLLKDYYLVMMMNNALLHVYSSTKTVSK